MQSKSKVSWPICRLPSIFVISYNKNMNRIVISGTYCTGKTTLSLALSLATGIPTTHALTMREILPILFPGKTLKQCSYSELLCLGMKRFEERIYAEAQLKNGFVSDGCALQEWIYGSTRLYTGAYPDEFPWEMHLKRIVNFKAFRNFEHQLKGFGGMAKAYVKTHYDLFFHLPVDFDFVSDGHRPTSELFRNFSEKLLVDTYSHLNIPAVHISGNPTERLEKILHYLNLPAIIPITTAIRQAEMLRIQKFDSVRLEQH
ncbi:ATP/GTP-binding protein [Sphingobacterium hungaricum]